MSAIDHFDLRSFDLNLLVAFDALMEDRTVTRAAARLKVQQPAMSHSLATLRMLMQDELFVRVGQVMQPTARARALAPQIRLALQHMQEALHADEGFDPATHTRTFRLGFSSELELLVMPALTGHLQRIAPGLKLLGRPIGRDLAAPMLDNGDIDLAVGCFDHSAARHRGRKLFEQALACCFNPDLLPLQPPIGVEAYLTTGHALITLNNTLQGCLDEALDRAGASLNVVMAGSEFLTVLATAAESPVLATLPSRMAQHYGPRFGLSLSPVPLELRVPDVAMVWSAQTDRDPGCAWLREQIVPLMTSHDTALAGIGAAKAAVCEGGERTPHSTPARCAEPKLGARTNDRRRVA